MGISTSVVFPSGPFGVHSHKLSRNSAKNKEHSVRFRRDASLVFVSSAERGPRLREKWWLGENKECDDVGRPRVSGDLTRMALRLRSRSEGQSISRDSRAVASRCLKVRDLRRCKVSKVKCLHLLVLV